MTPSCSFGYNSTRVIFSLTPSFTSLSHNRLPPAFKNLYPSLPLLFVVCDTHRYFFCSEQFQLRRWLENICGINIVSSLCGRTESLNLLKKICDLSLRSSHITRLFTRSPERVWMFIWQNCRFRNRGNLCFVHSDGKFAYIRIIIAYNYGSFPIKTYKELVYSDHLEELQIRSIRPPHKTRIKNISNSDTYSRK